MTAAGSQPSRAEAPTGWADLVADLPVRRWAKGDLIFIEGDEGDGLYVVDQGFVAIRKSTPNGDEVTVNVIGPGQSFGEQSLLLAHGRRTASAAALTDTTTRFLARARFEDLRRTSQTLADTLIDRFCTGMQRLSDQLVDALHAPADQRVLRGLVDLVPLFDDGSPTVTIRVTQEELASIAGVRRQTVNVVLRDAQESGVVRVRRGAVELLDTAVLSELAGRTLPPR